MLADCALPPDWRYAMKGREIISQVMMKHTADRPFIKFWRKENDFLDYDLVDRFIENVTPDEEIGGIELLTMDEMWNEVKKVAGKRVHLSNQKLEWDKNGANRRVCPYTPEALLDIFNSETRGNPIG